MTMQIVMEPKKHFPLVSSRAALTSERKHGKSPSRAINTKHCALCPLGLQIDAAHVETTNGFR
jgi:hypothetical protein